MIDCFSARILDPPQIRFRQGQGQNEMIESVNVGKWRIGRNRFYRAPEIKSWGLIYYGPPPNNQMDRTLNEFANQLPEVKPFNFDSIHFSMNTVSVVETQGIHHSTTLETSSNYRAIEY